MWRGYIEQALFYARSEALDRDYLIRAYRLGDLVNAAIRANAPALIAARVTPVVEGLDLEVFTDEKLDRVYPRADHPEQRQVRACRPADHQLYGPLVDEGLATEAVELSVADNGCASLRRICRACLRRLYRRQRSHGQAFHRHSLYLVKRLCDKMGVQLEASSRPGEGFTIRLRFSTNKFQYFE